MDFNGVRYFDLRDIDDIYYEYQDIKQKPLASDSTIRIDLIMLEANALEAAQKCKEDIEM